ncbi:MAG: orotidine-5'-phosphate decarboxylase [Fulvivirga sp.]|nr:orotidine-5'-phosphate decarboxylase [Fulvivirga sp.]
MNKKELFHQILEKSSYLCIGLDTDIDKIPEHLKDAEDPVFEFNKQIIDATHEFCVAYKPNIAFYEALGAPGWMALQKTLEYIPEDIFVIADAKRGDIGNTSRLYARAFFETLDVDALTIAPYMGEDSVKPFLEYKNKWAVILAHTSNHGSQDFQLMTERGTGITLYEKVMQKCQEWGSEDQLMFVVGATQAEKMERIREIAPEYFFLVPGVGAQGGDLEAVSAAGMNSSCGLLVNSSRGIIYAGEGRDFAKAARNKAKELQEAMDKYLDEYLQR